ncbi:MAG TPA: ribosomal L7Ae/L30e/S12e/Gadd45 family protein [Pseudogracilibacillus sp.]|nr:ribosomal L7Ae/L30e/S12e/Gadd45 family protein [Pseudogracilibacillus sp.]
MDNQACLSLLGLAFRAGKCILGEELILKEVRKGRVKLLLYADDISNQSQKRLLNKCVTYNVAHMKVGSRQELSQAIGKQDRVAIAITDSGFAQKLTELLS